MATLFWAICGIAAAALGYWLSAPLRADKDKRPALAVLAGVPLLALAAYLYLGNPAMPDAPLAPRLAGSLEQLPPAAVLARLEDELRQRPNDAQGWRLLARLHATTGNHPKAADSWQRLLDLDTDDVEAQTGLAIALIEQDGGVVAEAAVALLDRALAAEPDNLAALFWRAEAWAQQERSDKARSLWQRLRDGLADDAPLAKMLAKRLK